MDKVSRSNDLVDAVSDRDFLQIEQDIVCKQIFSVDYSSHEVLI